ncbi:MAG: hypothetical protein QXV22_02115 [Thermoplasmataceae archaeon]
MLETGFEKYVAILEDSDGQIVYKTQEERLLAGIFKKCLDGTLDPWDIDLKGFASVFSSLIDDAYDDLPVAGYLMTEAWKVLRGKTEESLAKRLREEDEQIIDDQIEEEAYSEPTEIVEPVRHKETRKVYLVELLDAMKAAIDKSVRIRREFHGMADQPAVDHIDAILERMNSEDPEKDIRTLWQKIDNYPADTFSLESLASFSGLDVSFIFLYCLFLAKEQRISLSQAEPYASILIRRTGQ